MGLAFALYWVHLKALRAGLRLITDCTQFVPCRFLSFVPLLQSCTQTLPNLLPIITPSVAVEWQKSWTRNTIGVYAIYMGQVVVCVKKICLLLHAYFSHPPTYSLDYFFGPCLPLRQLVEHSIIRGKDALVFSNPPPGEPIGGRTEVIFDMQVGVGGCVCWDTDSCAGSSSPPPTSA